jgi:uncharacterized protein (TIGR00255 family)
MRSMTGFGVGQSSVGGWRVEATIRALNHRFLTVRIRSLGERPWLSAQVEEMLRSAFHRGDLSVWFGVEQEDAPDGAAIRYDRALARQVYATLRALGDELGFASEPTLGDLIRAGGLQIPQQNEQDLWPAVQAALTEAVKNVQRTRTQEGAVLEAELTRLLDLLDQGAAAVEQHLPTILAGLREKLVARVQELEVSVEPARMEAEIALYADRFDIQEELVRLKGHLERAHQLVKRTKPVGKEFDFLGQEILREINTLGSKARDNEIACIVVDMKVAVEQLREQIQNVE